MKKGFTLIELLAVIVILAIISIIAIPQIAKVVDNARETANLRSVEGHIGNMDNNIAFNIKNNSYSSGSYTFGDFNFSKYPVKDKIRCESYDVEKSSIVSASNCVINNKYYCYSSSKGAYNCNGDSKSSVHPVEELASKRVKEIRNTPNTDISKRKGPIYYVSETGSDSNDGLSESKPLKTLDKLENMFSNGEIKAGSTILFKDGDTFRGKLRVRADDITLGSYGDISKGKPNIFRSTHDGAKEGKWVKVKGNIWKYTLNGSDKVFTHDVGTVWGYCNKNNNNCKMSMRDYSRKFEYAQKILTNEDYDETDIESKIDTLLKNDMEIYHTGHASRSYPKGEVLYIYSKIDPAKRFDEIEFNLSTNLIDATNYTDLTVDNLNIMYAGSHGIGTYGVANLTITNNEIAFIGGSKQKYDNGKPCRYGNAVQVWGGVDDKNGYTVKDGFLIDNNYTYQVYDTGFTFQYNGDAITHVEKAKFSNNVFDYMGAAIEYWIMVSTQDPVKLDNSYVNDFIVDNNIMMRSGYGIVETRPNKDQYGFVSSRGRLLHIKGKLLFKDNIFYKGKLKFFWLHRNSNNFPTFEGNTFYGDDDIKFAIIQDEDQTIDYDINVLSELFPGNTFKSLTPKTDSFNNDSGKINDITWNYNYSSKTLTIDGTGDMPDYTENKAPWSKYKDKIYHLVIGENISKIGNYSFYDFKNLITLKIN